MKKIISLVSALLMAVLLVLPVPAAARSNAVSETRNGVVRILAFEDNSPTYGTGSGLAVGEQGKPSSIFVTNNHVIAGADQIYVLLDNQWEKSVPAFGGKEDGVHAVKCNVISTPGSAPDYAILKSSREVTERVALPLMPAQKAAPGEQIYALGYPGIADAVTDDQPASIDDVTITSGTISRFVTDESMNTRCVQIDADINPGNSGGPLITAEGYVIGLNTKYFYNESSKVYLAIEIDYVIDKLNELIDSGTLSGFSFTVIEDPDDAADDVPGGASATDPDEAEDTSPAEEKDETEEEDDRKDNKKNEDKDDSDNKDDKKDNEDEEAKEDDEEGVSPIIIIIAVAAAFAALIAVILVMRKRKDQDASPVSRFDIDSTPQTPPVSPEIPAQPIVPIQPAFPLSSEGVGQETIPARAIKHTNPENSENVYCLVGLEGHYAGKKIPVRKDMCLGRKASSDIPFPSDTPGVSSVHCIVSPRPNGIVVIDQGSTYGTHTPSGAKLAPNQKYLLKPGDSFLVGNARQAFKVMALNAVRSASASGSAAGAGGAVFHLTGLSGPLTGKRYALTRNVRIGRSSANDIVFPEGTPGISGSHCMLIPQGDTVYLMDVGSTYGTFLENGSKLTPQEKHPLRKGDVFCLAGKGQSFRVD